MKTNGARLVLFIDGPLAGQVKQLPAELHYWNTVQVDGRATVFAGMPEPDRIMMDRITYQPIGGDSYLHQPEPWTCEPPAHDDATWFRALAKAWTHLHGMRGFSFDHVPPSTSEPADLESRRQGERP